VGCGHEWSQWHTAWVSTMAKHVDLTHGGSTLLPACYGLSYGPLGQQVRIVRCNRTFRPEIAVGPTQRSEWHQGRWGAQDRRRKQQEPRCGPVLGRCPHCNGISQPAHCWWLVPVSLLRTVVEPAAPLIHVPAGQSNC
jgi:hypothetical protein